MPWWGQLIIAFTGLVLVMVILKFTFAILLKARLIPLILYTVCTLLFYQYSTWGKENEQILFIIFIAILSLTALSWIVPLLKNIHEEHSMKRLMSSQLDLAKKMNIPLSSVTYDSEGMLIDKESREPVFITADDKI